MVRTRIGKPIVTGPDTRRRPAPQRKSHHAGPQHDHRVNNQSSCRHARLPGNSSRSHPGFGNLRLRADPRNSGTIPKSPSVRQDLSSPWAPSGQLVGAAADLDGAATPDRRVNAAVACGGNGGVSDPGVSLSKRGSAVSFAVAAGRRQHRGSMQQVFQGSRHGFVPGRGTSGWSRGTRLPR